eukprot:3296532-Amphidinium_carterae.1
MAVVIAKLKASAAVSLVCDFAASADVNKLAEVLKFFSKNEALDILEENSIVDGQPSPLEIHLEAGCSLHDLHNSLRWGC